MGKCQSRRLLGVQAHYSVKVKSQCSILKYYWLSIVGSCLRRTHKLTLDILILIGEAPLKGPENELTRCSVRKKDEDLSSESENPHKRPGMAV